MVGIHPPFAGEGKLLLAHPRIVPERYDIPRSPRRRDEPQREHKSQRDRIRHSKQRSPLKEVGTRYWDIETSFTFSSFLEPAVRAPVRAPLCGSAQALADNSAAESAMHRV